jgi:hypothetical protein
MFRPVVHEEQFYTEKYKYDDKRNVCKKGSWLSNLLRLTNYSTMWVATKVIFFNLNLVQFAQKTK